MFSTKEVRANEIKKKIHEKCFSEDSRLDFLYCEIRSFSVNFKSLKRHPILLCFMSENSVWISSHFRMEFRDSSQCMGCGELLLTINSVEAVFPGFEKLYKCRHAESYKINDSLALFCNLSRSQASRSQRTGPPGSQPQTKNDCRRGQKGDKV